MTGTGPRREGMRAIAGMATLVVSSLLFGWLTARWLGPTDRGAIVVFLNLAALLALAGSLGVPTSGRVLVAVHELTPRTMLRFGWILAGAHAVTASSLGVALLWLAHGAPEWWAGACFVPYAASVVFALMGRECLHGLGRHGAALFVEASPWCMQLGLVILLHLSGNLTLGSTIASIMAGTGIQLAGLLLCLYRSSVPQHSPGPGLQLSEAIRHGLPALGSVLGSAIALRADKVMLGVVVTSTAVGVYGVASAVSELLWIPATILAHFAFHRAATGDIESLRRMTTAVAALTAVAATVAYFLAPTLIPWIFGEDYNDAVKPFRVLVFATVPIALYFIDSAVLKGMGRFAAASRAALTGCGVILLLGAVLIPLGGSMGAAAASLAAYFLMFAVTRVERLRAQVEAGT